MAEPTVSSPAGALNSPCFRPILGIERVKPAMILNGRNQITKPESELQLSDELIALLRSRVAAKYYDQPEVIELIARAILHSRGLYP
jgi:hypothetical protein